MSIFQCHTTPLAGRIQLYYQNIHSHYVEYLFVSILQLLMLQYRNNYALSINMYLGFNVGAGQDKAHYNLFLFCFKIKMLAFIS